VARGLAHQAARQPRFDTQDPEELMRWMTFQARQGDGSLGEDRIGVVTGDRVHALDPGLRLADLVGDRDALARAGARATEQPAELFGLADVRVRPVIPQPRTIRDFSAFEEHCRTGLRGLGVDLSDKWFEIPVFYFGNANSVIGADDPVVPPGNTEKLDSELEIGLIVGEGGIDLDPATAADRIAGLCIFNDWSARDLQNEEMALVPIGPAKGKDFANGLGPYLVTLDELADRTKDGAFDLAMTASVNGKAYTKGNLADIYWSLGQLVAYASRGARLYPGDVIGTGTCGTGCILELSLVHGSQAYPWLKEGDEVVLEVERLGAMHSRIKAGVPVTPLK
jgi:2-keto-4-pentenoate hydratase/2-oxohepta-3-ene-1,7-dioic acid hydratase in catechol pathway